MVSSHYLASQAGMQVLQNGGNAVDAAIATAFPCALHLHLAANTGGGAFTVHHGADATSNTSNLCPLWT